MTKAMTHVPGALRFSAFQGPANNGSICDNSEHDGKLLNVQMNDVERCGAEANRQKWGEGSHLGFCCPLIEGYSQAQMSRVVRS